MADAGSQEGADNNPINGNKGESKPEGNLGDLPTQKENLISEIQETKSKRRRKRRKRKKPAVIASAGQISVEGEVNSEPQSIQQQKVENIFQEQQSTPYIAYEQTVQSQEQPKVESQEQSQKQPVEQLHEEPQEQPQSIIEEEQPDLAEDLVEPPLPEANEPGLAEEPDIGDSLSRRNSFFTSLRNVYVHISPVIGDVFSKRVIFTLVVSFLIIAGGIWAFSQGFHTAILGLFDFKEEVVEESVVEVDQDVLREYGLTTSLLLGSNQGSVIDLVPVQIRLADFFGSLSEPQASGETGISVATYYGELLDERYQINQFVEYVRKLDEIQNLFGIDVYAMLDRTTDRDSALRSYLNQLHEAREAGTYILKEIFVNIDELTVSFNSIKGDRAIFETDFFVSLEDLEAEKSDTLLKGFIDVSQKQVALKARVAALEKLTLYYETVLAKLDRRIDSVEKNQEALIEGIRVVDVPGAGIDIIIREE